MTFSKPFITVMRRNTTPLERMLLPSKPSSSPHPTSPLSIAGATFRGTPLLGGDGRRALSTATTPRQGFHDLDRDRTCINVEGGINMAGISRLASSSVTRPQPTNDVNGRMFSSIPTNFNLSSDGSGQSRFGKSSNNCNSNSSGNSKQSNEEAKKNFSTTSPTTSPTMAAKSTNNNNISGSSRSSADNEDIEQPSTSSSDPTTTPKTKQSFRSMVRQYGPVFVGTYLTVYVSTVSAFFVGIESGALDPAYVLSFLTAAGDGDAEFQTTAQIVARLLDHYSWTRPAVPYIQDHPAAANFAVAWLATKPTEPIRFGVTVALVPTVARTFGYAGSNSSSSNSSSNNSTRVPETKAKDEPGVVTTTAGPTKTEPTK